MDLTRIPERDEIPEEYTWDLRDLFPDDEAWAAEHRALVEMPARIAPFAGTLAERPGRLLDWLKLEDELAVRLERLSGYAHCKGDQDISVVARAMGGGGHRAASGFTSEGSIPEVFAKVLPLLEEALVAGEDVVGA